jgi:aromatic-amino-acid transaminase
VAFANLTPLAPDPVLALMERFRTDPRVRKMDLGVGMYRDARGETPVFAAVKLAEKRLLEEQPSKSYLGSGGDQDFVARLGALVFDSPGNPRSTRMAGLQTVGGTGALRLASDLLASSVPGRRIWLPAPTWPNHAQIFAASGLQVMTLELFDPATGSYGFEGLLSALRAAEPGDAVLLHGCCHNPTGVDPSPGFWVAVAEQITARGLVPLVDLAYQGMGRGWDEDGSGLRCLAERAPQLLVAYSCDKNFGLYRERVGALFVAGRVARETALLGNHLQALARANYSMPPDHGASVVRIILEDETLLGLWAAELERMRMRIHQLRAALAAHGRLGAVDLGLLKHGQGMFALLPISPQEVDLLNADFGIYMARSGRINIAGLAEDEIERFVMALRNVQRKTAA